jgi:hypothetical protein
MPSGMAASVFDSQRVLARRLLPRLVCGASTARLLRRHSLASRTLLLRRARDHPRGELIVTPTGQLASYISDAVGSLLVASVLAARMSEVLVGAAEPTGQAHGMSEVFIAIVFLALIGGAADRRSNWYKGVQLILMDAMIAVLFYFLPAAAGT